MVVDPANYGIVAVQPDVYLLTQAQIERMVDDELKHWLEVLSTVANCEDDAFLLGDYSIDPDLLHYA